MELLMKGTHIPEPYINDKKELKLFVLRPASKEEQEQMKAMQGQMTPKSDLIGKKADPFSVTDINGNTISLESLKGKIVVINFWFVECKPCIMEIPELNKIVDLYKDKEVVFLGFATNEQSKIITCLLYTSPSPRDS